MIGSNVHGALCRVVMASNHQIDMDNLEDMDSSSRHHKAMASHRAIGHQELRLLAMVPLANSLVCCDQFIVLLIKLCVDVLQFCFCNFFI